MRFFAFNFLHARPLAGEGRGEGPETKIGLAILRSSSLCLIFLGPLFNQSSRTNLEKSRAAMVTRSVMAGKPDLFLTCVEKVALGLPSSKILALEI